MRLRATALGVLAIAFAGVLAAAVPDTRWRAVAAPPRPSLPQVEVIFGYPGPYIPMASAPIELRAKAAVRFSGYVGFRYAVGRDRTGDLPVLTKLQLAPGQESVFVTWSKLAEAEWWRAAALPMNRELVIEWRDARMRVLASRSLGVPPWSRKRPLALSTSARALTLGAEPVALDIPELSEKAQWYAGFAAAVMPLATWIDLSQSQKDAIFGSGVPLVFTGFARQGQTLSDVDRALLPVEFTPGGASYRVPWPYAEPGVSREAPLSWRPRRSAVSVGDPALPPIVIGRSSSWAASDDLVERPLPVTATIPLVANSAGRRVWSASIAALQYRTVIAAVLMLLVSIGSWLVLRRTSRHLVLVVAIACAVAVLAVRHQLRDLSTARLEEIRELGDGVVARRVQLIESGSSPLPARRVDAALARTAVFTSDPLHSGSEVRDSATPAGFGGITSLSAGLFGVDQSGWDTVVRVWQRREAGRGPSIKVVSADQQRLVFDYDAPEDVEFAAATWFANGRRYFGEAKLAEPRRGRVEIRNESIRPTVGFSQLRYIDENGVPVYEWALITDTTRINLFRRDQGGWKQFDWAESARDPAIRRSPFSMKTDMLRTADGKLTATFLIPPEAVDPAARARAAMYGNVPLRQLNVSTAAGTLTVQNELVNRPVRQRMFSSGVGRFAIPASILPTVANGGIVTVTADPAEALTADAVVEMVLVFEEKKS